MRFKCSKSVLRLVGGFFAALLLISSGSRAAIVGQAEELSLYATSAVLMDADSGRVLYEKNGYTPMAMASTTKIMTCILVLEEGNLDDWASVSAYASTMPKVKMYVSQGEEYQVRSLLFSLMLESHNDSAVVLAEYIGKQYLSPELAQKNTADFTIEESKQAVKAFAKRMNEKARELGCESTWFITPNGLDATETFEINGESVTKEHSTTAAELARIMAYCVKESPCRDVFREITRTPSYSFCENGRNVTCVNHNTFLSMMDGAFSGKTGFTNKAGYCYVGALERDGKTFIVALLACGWPNNKTYKWSDSTELMEYGLDNFDFREFLGEESAYDTKLLKALPVVGGQTKRLGETAYVEVEIPGRNEEHHEGLLMGHEEEIEVICDVRDSLEAPVKAGAEVGNITYRVDGKVYFVESVTTKTGVERIDLKWCTEQIWKRFLIL